MRALHGLSMVFARGKDLPRAAQLLRDALARAAALPSQASTHPLLCPPTHTTAGRERRASSPHGGGRVTATGHAAARVPRHAAGVLRACLDRRGGGGGVQPGAEDGREELELQSLA